MSANSVVTVLRSPPIAELSACSALMLICSDLAAAADGAALPPSRVPHCLQKLASAGFCAPHFTQRLPLVAAPDAEFGVIGIVTCALRAAHGGYPAPLGLKTVQTKPVSAGAAKSSV